MRVHVEIHTGTWRASCPPLLARHIPDGQSTVEPLSLRSVSESRVSSALLKAAGPPMTVVPSESPRSQFLCGPDPRQLQLRGGRLLPNRRLNPTGSIGRKSAGKAQKMGLQLALSFRREPAVGAGVQAWLQCRVAAVAFQARDRLLRPEQLATSEQLGAQDRHRMDVVGSSFHGRAAAVGIGTNGPGFGARDIARRLRQDARFALAGGKARTPGSSQVRLVTPDERTYELAPRPRFVRNVSRVVFTFGLRHKALRMTVRGSLAVSRPSPAGLSCGLSWFGGPTDT